MKNYLSILLSALIAFSPNISLADKVQKQGIKTSAECIAAGATNANCLPEDTQIYVTANGLNKQLSAAITAGDIGGGGGGTVRKNYAPSNGTFDAGTTGWDVFNTTFNSDGVPETITTGSTKVAISQETSSPLAGSGSLKFDVTTASGSAGHGFISDAMTIEDADLAAPFLFSWFYKTTSGSSTLDFSGTSTQTFEFWIYNVGLATWTQPSGYRGINSKDVAMNVTGQFQTDSQKTSNKNQYRLALIIKNAPSGTSTTLFDQFQFGQGSKVYGFAGADEIPFTSTTGLTGGTTTFTSTYRRVGGSAHVKIKAGFTSIFTGGSATFSLPFTIDSSSARNGSAMVADATVLGKCSLIDAGTATYPGMLLYHSDTSVICRQYEDDSGTGSGFVANGAITTTTPFTWANGDVIDIGEFSVPILGWSSNVQSSADTDTRVVAARMNNSTTSLVAATPTQVVFTTVDYDTHGAINAGKDTFTVPISGYYRMCAAVLGASIALINGDSFYLRAYKNGSAFTVIAPTINAGSETHRMAASGCTSIKANAGDTLALFVSQPQTGSIPSGNENAWVSFERISGPSQVQAAEKVIARAQGSTTTVGTSETDIVWSTELEDTHGAFNGTSFVCPRSGYLKITARIQCGATSGATVRDTVDLSVKKNSDASIRIDYWQEVVNTTLDPDPSGSYTYKCNAGDSFKLTTARGSSLSSFNINNSSETYVIFEMN